MSFGGQRPQNILLPLLLETFHYLSAALGRRSFSEGGKGNGKLFFGKIIRVISLKIIGFFMNGTCLYASFS
jgi:hypothetical protein